MLDTSNSLAILRVMAGVQDKRKPHSGANLGGVGNVIDGRLFQRRGYRGAVQAVATFKGKMLSAVAGVTANQRSASAGFTSSL